MPLARVPPQTLQLYDRLFSLGSSLHMAYCCTGAHSNADFLQSVAEHVAALTGVPAGRVLVALPGTPSFERERPGAWSPSREIEALREASEVVASMLSAAGVFLAHAPPMRPDAAARAPTPPLPTFCGAPPNLGAVTDTPQPSS